MDVTLVTFVSEERLDNLETVLKQWSGKCETAVEMVSLFVSIGPVSVAYYAHSHEDISRFDVEMASFEKDVVDRVTVHLVMVDDEEDDVPFPINALRNIASIGVRTSHMFHVDIDFLPNYRMRETIL